MYTTFVFRSFWNDEKQAFEQAKLLSQLDDGFEIISTYSIGDRTVLVLHRDTFSVGDSPADNSAVGGNELREGVTKVDTPRGPRYFENGKMIKTSEAYE